MEKLVNPKFKRLWVVTVGEPLPIDLPAPKLIRTGLMSAEFVRRGIDVVWWTSTFDHSAKMNRFRATTEKVLPDGTLLVLLHGPDYKRNVSLKRIRNHRRVASEFRRKLHSGPLKPDAILVSYPTIELAYEAVRWGRENDVPVIVDVRDLWPDIFIDFVQPGLRTLAKLVLSSDFRKARRAFKGATAIWGVSKRYRDFGLAYAARSSTGLDSVIPIPTRRVGSIPDDYPRVRARLIAKGVDPTKRIFWFVGSFAKTYDLSTVIRAARSHALSGLADLQFVFSGGGERDAEWRMEATGAPNVVFTGWLDAHEVIAMGQMSYVGLQAYAPGAPQGLANKLVDYLRFGLPVLGCLKGENEEFLTAHKCGLTYQPGDSDSLVRAVLELIRNGEMHRSMASQAAHTFGEIFELQVVCDQAIRTINNVVHKGKHSGNGLTPDRVTADSGELG